MRRLYQRHHLLKCLSALAGLSRWLIGLTFVAGGMTKAADPAGMALKLGSYADALGLHALFHASPLIGNGAATALGTAEWMLGISLLCGFKRASTLRLTLGVMMAMTGLTVWLYVASPISDCGCFGEAIRLTNGQTLAKNIVLLACSLFLLTRLRHRLQLSITAEYGHFALLSTLSFAVVTALYSLHFLPVADFGPYAKGTDIQAVFDSTPDTDDNRPSTGDADASGITGAHPLNFYVYRADTGEDLTFELLADTSYTFLLTLPETQTADDGTCDRIADLYDLCTDRRIHFYMATAADSAGIAEWKDLTGANYPILCAEETELRAMVRSNPGLLLLKDGVVVNKWSCNNLPDADRPATIFIAAPDHRPLLGGGWKALGWYLVIITLIVIADRLRIAILFYQHHIYFKRLKPLHTMRKKIVAGNWKMNLNLQEGVALAKELNAALTADKPACDVVICTPFIHLASVAAEIDPALIGLGAENCADKVKGAYTGEVSAEQVKSTGATYVILGHSERRAYYHETPEILKEKVNLALANGLKVIFCIGEVLEEREAEKQNDVVKAQLEGSLFDLSAEEFKSIILAYEPVWAIGTGKTATAEQAEEMHAFIRATIADKFGADAAENVSILYGGSCKPSNAKEIFAKPNVDGGLIGGAALKAADFKGIIDAWKD